MVCILISPVRKRFLPYFLVSTKEGQPHSSHPLRTPSEGASRKMLDECLKLTEQVLQRWPTVEINNDTRVCGKGRTMVRGIIDIKAHVDYTSLYRRHLWCMWLQKHHLPR